MANTDPDRREFKNNDYLAKFKNGHFILVSTLFLQGCYDSVLDLIKSQSAILIGVGCGIACLEVRLKKNLC